MKAKESVNKDSRVTKIKNSKRKMQNCNSKFKIAPNSNLILGYSENEKRGWKFLFFSCNF